MNYFVLVLILSQYAYVPGVQNFSQEFATALPCEYQDYYGNMSEGGQYWCIDDELRFITGRVSTPSAERTVTCAVIDEDIASEYHLENISMVRVTNIDEETIPDCITFFVVNESTGNYTEVVYAWDFSITKILFFNSSNRLYETRQFHNCNSPEFNRTDFTTVVTRYNGFLGTSTRVIKN